MAPDLLAQNIYFIYLLSQIIFLKHISDASLVTDNISEDISEQ